MKQFSERTTEKLAKLLGYIHKKRYDNEHFRIQAVRIDSNDKAHVVSVEKEVLDANLDGMLSEHSILAQSNNWTLWLRIQLSPVGMAEDTYWVCFRSINFWDVCVKRCTEDPRKNVCDLAQFKNKALCRERVMSRTN